MTLPFIDAHAVHFFLRRCIIDIKALLIGFGGVPFCQAVAAETGYSLSLYSVHQYGVEDAR